MRTTFTTIGFALTMLFATAPAFAECEVGCAAECRQETAICTGAANLESRIGRQQCGAEAADSLIVCETDSLDARADCVGLCGPDLKTCGGTAKATLKQCKESVKVDRALCENAVAALLASDRAACAEDAGACAESCVE